MKSTKILRFAGCTGKQETKSDYTNFPGLSYPLNTETETGYFEMSMTHYICVKGKLNAALIATVDARPSPTTPQLDFITCHKRPQVYH